MSEYQYFHFQAVDRPLDDEQLAFMRAQSTRAEGSRWTFTNEYHYGDFHGDSHEMMRRGYDFHLHFSNCGARALLFRMPAGLLWDRGLFDSYSPYDEVGWFADKEGSAGILAFYPDLDAESYSDGFFNIGAMASQLVGIRDLLLAGDLRPLYLAWLGFVWSDDELEPPVPAGLGELPSPLQAFAEFYEIDPDLITAAAQRSPSLANNAEQDEQLIRWIEKQPAPDL